MDKNDMLRARTQLMLGKALRAVAVLALRAGLSLMDVSGNLTSEAGRQLYNDVANRLLDNESGELKMFLESAGATPTLLGQPPVDAVELVRFDPATLPALENPSDEVERLEFLRTNGELMPKWVELEKQYPGLKEPDDLFATDKIIFRREDTIRDKFDAEEDV